MHMSVEILPEAEALIRRAGQGRERPNSQAVGVVPTPTGRTSKALLAQLNIPTYHFHREEDVEELDKILKYTFMCNKPVAILTDASFWKGY